MSGRAVKIGLPVLLLLIGSISMGALIKGRKRAPKISPDKVAPLVAAIPVAKTDEPIVLRGQGEVMPARSVRLAPEVAGRLIHVNRALVAGGELKRGEVMLRVDTRDYTAAVEQQRATLARARLELAMEQGRGEVARREWASVQTPSEGTQQGAHALAMREPQLQAAKASVAAAEAGLRRARLNLERTTLRAPFDALVLNETVEVGQRVAPQAPVAELVATDVYWVQVALPQDQVRFLKLPDARGEGGSLARIFVTTGGRREIRAGVLLRLLGAVDRTGRMARVVLGVSKPRSAEEGAPLLLHGFVDVEIDGVTLEGVIPIPRAAMHPDGTVYTVNGDSKLERRPVTVVWKERDRVLVAEGLEAGDRVVTSIVGAPLPGTPVRVAGEQKGEASL